MSESAHISLNRQVTTTLRAVLNSPVRKRLITLVTTIVFVVIATAYMQIRLNGWNKPFYDALSRRDLRDFLLQLGVFFLIAGHSARAECRSAMAGGDPGTEAS